MGYVKACPRCGCALRALIREVGEEWEGPANASGGAIEYLEHGILEVQCSECGARWVGTYTSELQEYDRVKPFNSGTTGVQSLQGGNVSSTEEISAGVYRITHSCDDGPEDEVETIAITIDNPT